MGLRPPPERKPRLDAAVESVLPHVGHDAVPSTTEGKRFAYRRMAGWIRTGLQALKGAPPPTTRTGARERSVLEEEGQDLHTDAQAGGNGAQPEGGVRGLWQRVGAWIGKVRSWVRNHLPPRRQDRFLKALNEVRSEVQVLGRRLDRLEEGQDKLQEGQDKLQEGQDKLWGEVSGARGERFERLAHTTLHYWLRTYSIRNEHALPRIETLWSDRVEPGSENTWWSLAEDLGLDSTRNVDVERCDILLRATWTADERQPSLLICGEVSTQMDDYRQAKVQRQYEALTEAGHTVLPVIFGLYFDTLIDLPLLLEVRMDNKSLNRQQRPSYPEELSSVLDSLLGFDA